MSTQPPPPPDAAAAGKVLELISAFRASKAMFTAVELGLFDRLHERPASTAELAASEELAAHALERLLGFLASQGFLTRGACLSSR